MKKEDEAYLDLLCTIQGDIDYFCKNYRFDKQELLNEIRESKKEIKSHYIFFGILETNPEVWYKLKDPWDNLSKIKRDLMSLKLIKKDIKNFCERYRNFCEKYNLSKQEVSKFLTETIKEAKLKIKNWYSKSSDKQRLRLFREARQLSSSIDSSCATYDQTEKLISTSKNMSWKIDELNSKIRNLEDELDNR